MSEVDEDGMESDPTTPEARLVDIVVEEVSLVDQAANKRQFLVIKRARSGMSKTNVTNESDEANEASTLEAIERVGKSVAELADEIDEPSDVARLVAIAEQLGELVRSIFEADEEEAEEEDEEEQANGDDPAAPPAAATPATAPPDGAAPTPAGGPNAAAFAKIEAMLAALRTKAAISAAPDRAPSPAPAPVEPPAPAPTPPATDPLAKVLDAIQSLSTDIKAQARRLGRLEKGVGLPSSQQTTERPRREPDEVSWPLDLNAPVSRDSVDKRVSFHDD